MEKQVTTHVVKGVLISAIIIVFSIITYVFNLYDIKALSYVSPALIFAGIIVSVILYSNQKNNTVPFGNLFAHGFVTTCVIIALTSLYTILSVKLLFPDMVEKMLVISKKQMLENKNVKEEMIEPALDFTRKYFLPLTLSFAIVFSAIIGVVASLIGAAVSKKKTNPFENNPTN
jgi:hypothetical protein